DGVGLFEGNNYLLGHTASGQKPIMGAPRGVLVFGVVLVVVIPMLAGAPAEFFRVRMTKPPRAIGTTAPSFVFSMFAVYVPARLVRRLPPARIRDVIAVDSMNACDDREFIEAAAIALGNIECVALGFRRPGDDSADIIAFWTINADA